MVRNCIIVCVKVCGCCWLEMWVVLNFIYSVFGMVVCMNCVLVGGVGMLLLLVIISVGVWMFVIVFCRLLLCIVV